MTTHAAEIIIAPFTIYLAPVGTAFPDLNTDPVPTAWTALSAQTHYEEGTVTIAKDQTVETVTPGGSTEALKAYRTDESLMVRVSTLDMTVETFEQWLATSIATTTATATEVGTKEIGLTQGVAVAEYALLVRGTSAVNTEYLRQYNLPRVVQQGSLEVTHSNRGTGLVAFEFMALADLTAPADRRLGYLVEQHQATI